MSGQHSQAPPHPTPIHAPELVRAGCPHPNPDPQPCSYRWGNWGSEGGAARGLEAWGLWSNRPGGAPLASIGPGRVTQSLYTYFLICKIEMFFFMQLLCRIKLYKCIWMTWHIVCGSIKLVKRMITIISTNVNLVKWLGLALDLWPVCRVNLMPGWFCLFFAPAMTVRDLRSWLYDLKTISFHF